jgi:integrase
MFLSKHKNGFYYIYYEDADGRRQAKSTRTKYKSEAIKVLSNFAIDHSKQKSQIKEITLKQFRWEFLKTSESYHASKTTKDYRSTFNEMEKHFGNILLSKFVQKGIEEFIQKKIREESIYTGRRHLIYIKALFNRAVELDYIKNSPAKSIKRIRTPEKLPTFFSKEEYEQLLNEVNDRDYKDVIEFAVNTGLRQMEILTLRRQQFNEAERLIILDNQSHTTKSKRVRTIPLNTRAYEILIKRIGDIIFAKDGGPISPDHLQDRFRKYVENAGLIRKLTFHSLRHTFASWLVQAGVSIYEVSKLLGHSDIKTTQIYAHLRNEDLKRAVDLII